VDRRYCSTLRHCRADSISLPGRWACGFAIRMSFAEVVLPTRLRTSDFAACTPAYTEDRRRNRNITASGRTGNGDRCRVRTPVPRAVLWPVSIVGRSSRTICWLAGFAVVEHLHLQRLSEPSNLRDLRDCNQAEPSTRRRLAVAVSSDASSGRHQHCFCPSDSSSSAADQTVGLRSSAGAIRSRSFSTISLR
jgi:hypothetical protein